MTGVASAMVSAAEAAAGIAKETTAAAAAEIPVPTIPDRAVRRV